MYRATVTGTIIVALLEGLNPPDNIARESKTNVRYPSYRGIALRSPTDASELVEPLIKLHYYCCKPLRSVIVLLLRMRVADFVHILVSAYYHCCCCCTARASAASLGRVTCEASLLLCKMPIKSSSSAKSSGETINVLYEYTREAFETKYQVQQRLP